MGQTLQKLRGGGSSVGRRAAVRGAAPLRPHANNTNIEAGVKPPPSSSPSPQTVRQSVEVRPQAPEPHLIVEPGQNLGDWDRGDPKYSAMVQLVVGKISTRPGGNQEMGSAHVTAEFRRPKPANRHTSAATGPDEEKVVTAGTLNIAGIQEALRLYQGFNAEGGKEQPKVDVKSLAEKFNVDVVLLERVLKYTSLPEPPRNQKLRA